MFFTTKTALSLKQVFIEILNNLLTQKLSVNSKITPRVFISKKRNTIRLLDKWCFFFGGVTRI